MFFGDFGSRQSQMTFVSMKHANNFCASWDNEQNGQSQSQRSWQKGNVRIWEFNDVWILDNEWGIKKEKEELITRMYYERRLCNSTQGKVRCKQWGIKLKINSLNPHCVLVRLCILYTVCSIKWQTLLYLRAITSECVYLNYDIQCSSECMVELIVLVMCFSFPWSSGVDYSSPWRESFNASRESIRQNLHILHPSMQTILGICQSKNYSTMLITDQSNLR